eukprot:GHVO01004967.1.p1 GENE.GHVO01004967.1~~GHVO01004967.1.p1  ORF type:complete len:122 (+),score=26.14 GHVO01004967.1:269-634(+)
MVLEWGKGLVQKEDTQRKKIEDAKTAAEPLARYSIDEDYASQLKQQERWDDPMKKDNEWVEEKDGRPQCRFPAPFNRYQIRPGYRWDGVIRGTGFEERFEEAKIEKSRREKVWNHSGLEDL